MNFDPYESWLGIPLDRRPPTHYDLLGLAPSESDPAKIEQSALRRMGKIRQFQIGEHSEQSQEILNQLARARLVLLDPDRRAEYDEKLEKSARGPLEPPLLPLILTTSREPDERAFVHEEPTAIDTLIVTGDEINPGARLRSRRRPTVPTWVKALSAVVILASHGALLWLFINRDTVFGPSVRNLLTREQPRSTVAQAPTPTPTPAPASPTSRPRQVHQLRPAPSDGLRFDGRTHITVAEPGDFDMAGGDYTIFAWINSRRDGAIFSEVSGRPPTVEHLALFIDDRNLAFGTCGGLFLRSDCQVADGRWHEVAVTREHKQNRVTFYVDGDAVGVANLALDGSHSESIVRIGCTSFSKSSVKSHFTGKIAELRYFDRALNAREIHALGAREPAETSMVARWIFKPGATGSIPDQSGHGHHGTLGAEVASAREAVAANGNVIRPGTDPPEPPDDDATGIARDPIAIKLQAAKDDYRKKIDKIKEEVRAAVDHRISLAKLKPRSAPTVERYTAEKNAFELDQNHPPASLGKDLIKYVNRISAARNDLRVSYELAIRQYSEAESVFQASGIRSELKAWLAEINPKIAPDGSVAGLTQLPQSGAPRPPGPALDTSFLVNSEWKFLRQIEGLPTDGVFKITNGAIFHTDNPQIPVGQAAIDGSGQLHLNFLGHRKIGEGYAICNLVSPGEWQGVLYYAGGEWNFRMTKR
jgi:hypothetical protein